MYFYKNKKILVTGDTGFKGSWLCIWLTILGAEIIGISNKIEKKSNYSICKLDKFWEHKDLDIIDENKLLKEIKKINPDIIFNLAAQSLVCEAKLDPKYTIHTNIIGTFNLLNSLRQLNKKCVLINISTDKVYKERKSFYKEDDLLGGNELYGASKSCGDIISQSFYNTYFEDNNNIGIAISRAGNIIGGGDYSKNRIVTDIINSIRKKKDIIVRNPNFTRPWQYILDALNAYLILGKKLYNEPNKYSDIFNFGPYKSYKVIDLVENFIKIYGQGNYILSKDNNKFYESKDLFLNSQKALRLLNWKNKIDFEEAIKYTVEDYKEEKSKNILEKRINRINKFQDRLILD